MKIVHADEVAPRRASGPGEGDVTLRLLLQGDPGGLGKHELSLVRHAGRFRAPRQRRNFEQFRMILEGEFGWATRRKMKAGQLGYFPEGTPYGPEDTAACLALTLRCAGPSGQELLSHDQLQDGREALAKLGGFVDGVFQRAPAADAAAPGRKQDGYEAIWEHVRGRKLSIPAKRYDEPVIVTPAALAWEPTDTAGVDRKLLGAFDHGACAELLRIELGAKLVLEAPQAIQLLFVLEGAGRAEGRVYRRWSALEVPGGGRVGLDADAPTELLRLGVPAISAAAAARLGRAA